MACLATLALLSCRDPQVASSPPQQSGRPSTCNLSVGDLNPPVGAKVRIWAACSGTWPPSPGWKGVDTHDGSTALLIPRKTGPADVNLHEAGLTIQAQPAANHGAVSVASVSIPLYDLRFPCQDQRFPRLAGPWALGCGPQGQVDMALDLRSRQLVRLNGPSTSPAAAPGFLYAPGQGLWTLPQPEPVEVLAPGNMDPVASPATDGLHVAITGSTRVTGFDIGSHQFSLIEADPMPWYPPALAWPWMAWVDGRDRASTGADIWALDLSANDRAFPLARQEGDQRHVGGDGRWLGWLDHQGAWVQDMQTSQRRHVTADTGFRAGMSLWGPVACFEDRSRGSPDVICTDGMEVRKDGDQGFPSRWGPWLLYRDEGLPTLATAREIIMDEDDPRASSEGSRVAGGFRGAHRDSAVIYRFSWPVSGWCVQTWLGEGWRTLGEMPLGSQVEIKSPGDAIRLLPARSSSCEEAAR